jgi:hypothetical protein
MRKRGQSAIEFLILTGAVLIFFLAFLGAIQYNIREKTQEKTRLEVREVALTLQNEISLARDAGDGYRRDFWIPTKISGLDYEVQIFGELLQVNMSDGRHAMALFVGNVTGQPDLGENSIENEGGEVLLNQ